MAFTILLNRSDSVLSPHFGKAKWILIRDDSGQIVFEQNFGLNGLGVVDILVSHGCTDAVFTQIGFGALNRLGHAGIRGWIGLANVQVPRLMEMLSRGELERARAPKPKPATTLGEEGNRELMNPDVHATRATAAAQTISRTHPILERLHLKGLLRCARLPLVSLGPSR